MAQEPTTSAYAPPQAVGANNGSGIGSVRPQELQNMRLVIDVGNGKTLEIPLQGYLVATDQGAHGSDGEPSTGAVAEPEDGAEAKKYLNDMRGWIMTVATLFATLSFQAISERPSWMPEPSDGWKIFFGQFPRKEARQVIAYVLLNTITFTSSLVVLVILLLPDMSSPKDILYQVRTMMMTLAATFALNFALTIAKDPSVTGVVFTVMPS